MALNMKTLQQALAKTAAVIEKTVTTTVNEVTGPRPLQDYDLLDQIGSGGPGLAWKLYSARPRGSAPSTQYPLVCVWVLEKRVLSEARTKAGLSKAAEDSFLEIVRTDAAKLVRLRHPGVVHVVQALDESKNAMAMVTEPLFASVANALGNVENIAKVPKELKGMEMSLLEIKHGLLQIAETLDFLHNNARLVHRSISPETVYITSSGAWKLGGFGFAVSIDQMSGDSNASSPFHYAEYDIEDSVLPLQPSLNYTAPELVRNKALSVGCSSDMFSCGCLAYHLVARKPLLDCHNNVKMYMNSLSYLSNETFSIIPPDLTSDLRRMLSMDGASRPSASDFTGSSFFRDDTRLRALRFLDHMLERDNMQKTEFLKALSDMWKDFDSRVLRYKVLPPLCAELRNVVMQPMILPMVLTIAESQEKNEFELSTLPSLAPVLKSASGDTLLLLVKHSDLIINKATHEYLITHVLPLLVRAYDDTDARIQEEVLRRTVPLAKQLDTQLVKQAILPRVHSLALRTTIAAVRVNALRCLGDMVPSIDKHAVLEILQTLQRCTAVDRSAPTLVCTLSVANSIFKKHGVEFTVEHVLPLLFPLLTAQQLNVQQFAKYMLFVKDILRMIEEKRGVTLTDYENSEGRIPPSVSNRLQSVQVPPTTTSAKSSSSWDEDWGRVKKDATISSVTLEPNFPLKTITPVTNPTQVAAFHVQSGSAPSADQAQPVCPPVDIEWPPRNPSASFGSHLGVVENKKQYTGGTLDVTFDDVDPFADWPPRPGNQGTSIGSGINNRPSLGVSGLNAVNTPSPNNRNATGQQSQYQDNFFNISKSNGSLLNPQRPSSNHGSSMIGDFSVSNTGSLNHSQSNPNLHTAKRRDIGSIFTSANNEQTPLRIAPPPATAAGRGRGRPQGSLRPPPQSSQPSHAKAASEQRNLLDLL